MKKQNKLLVASLLAVPAVVAVAGAAQAAETTLPMFEVHNDFVTASNTITVESSVEKTAATKAALQQEIINALKSYTTGFTITYEAGTKDNYKQDVEDVFAAIKSKLNTIENTVDYTMLYGTFNNLRVEATEIKGTDGNVQSVRLQFSVQYFLDQSSETALNSLIDNLTTGANSIYTTATTDVQKLKAAHDYAVKNFYVVPSENNLSALVLNKRGSSHAYALFMYKLLSKAGITGLDAKYVAGRVDGEVHAWNVVTLGGSHYHFDTAANDSIIAGDNSVSYQNFLAGNTQGSNRHIYYGLTNPTWGNAYAAFNAIVNPAEAGNKLYYADAEFGGKLKELDVSVIPTARELPLTGSTPATSEHGGVAYYTYTSSDTVTVYEDLYFINNAVGNYLYKYNLKVNEEVLLLDKTQVRAIEGISGTVLVYYTAANERKTIDLTDVTSFNGDAAQEVIATIQAIGATTGEAKKNKIIEARKQYNTLTVEQQALVTNKQDLFDAEQAIIDPAAGPLVRSIINGINALDPLKNTYYDDVNKLLADYNNINATNKSRVYNYTILAEAGLLLTEVESLQTVLADFVINGGTSPFENINNALVLFDSLYERYHALLPSLKTKIDPAHASYLATYKYIATQLRLDVIALENEIEKIDATSNSYLSTMKTLQATYTNLYESQKEIMKPIYKTKIEQHIATTTTLVAQVTALDALVADIMGTATTVADVEIKVETVAKVNDAQVKYTALNPEQLTMLKPATVNNLPALVTRIENLVSDPKVLLVKAAIEALDYREYNGNQAGLADLTPQVTSVDTAYIDLGGLQVGLPSETVQKLNEYKAVVAENGAKATQALIDALTNTSTKAQVQAARASYEALSGISKYFIVDTNLVDQELRLQLIDDTAAATRVEGLIADLSEQSSLQEILYVKEEFDKLTTAAKGKVPQAAKDKLNTLYAAKQGEMDALIRQARAVEAMIDLLSTESTVEEVRAARQAYEALDAYAKAYVSAEALTKLVDLEDYFSESIYVSLALELDNDILSITDQTSLERVLEIKQKFDDATAEVKALVREENTLNYWVDKKTTENEALIEQAKKEAQLVIDRIDKISTEHTEAHIRAIRAAYEALSDLAKTFVTNLAKLEEAEANIIYENTTGKEARAEASAFDTYMADLSRKSEKEDVREARKHYNRLSDEAKKYVTTYNKLKRLEEMFTDKDYEDLFENYYPHYVDDPKLGGVEPVDPEEVAYDPLYIPDETTQYFAYTEYEENKSTLITGGFIQINPKQLQHNTNKTITFTASNNVEITFPVAELKNAKGAIGVTLKTDNEEVIVTFTENNRLKSFTDTVLITVPFGVLGATSGMKVEGKAYSGEQVKAVYKVDGTKFIISTKQSGTFTVATTAVGYTDLVDISESRKQAIRELGQRGIVSGGTATTFQPKAYIVRKDIAVMVATALNLTTTSTTKYTDVSNAAQKEAAQAVLEAGVMRGVTATTFRPYNELSREQAAIIVANVLRQQKVPVAITKNPQTTSYSDAMSYEGQQSVAVLELAGILNGTGNFQPNGKMTRGEFAEWLYKALKISNAL